MTTVINSFDQTNNVFREQFMELCGTMLAQLRCLCFVNILGNYVKVHHIKTDFVHHIT